MINYIKLQEALSQYKSEIAKLWKTERYKWVAVQHFQDHWDIDAENFADMFKEAIAKTGNLLNSHRNLPGGQMIMFAREYPQEVKEMFSDLYDESKVFIDRINHFKYRSIQLFEMHNAAHPNDVNSKTCYQNDNAVTTYLWLRYPDKYFIYKYSEYTAVEKILCDTHNIKKGSGLEPGYALYEQIRKQIREDQTLVAIRSQLLSSDCYQDSEWITTTIDFGFFISRYCQNNLVHEPRYWVVNHKYDNASPSDLQNLREQALRANYAYMQEEYGVQSTPIVTMNWNLAVQVKQGDYIFLRNGERIYAVGQAISPRKTPTIELNAQNIIAKKDLGKYTSGQFQGVIAFEDAEVFYDDLSDGEESNWGQRLDVDAWRYYTPDGVPPIKEYLDSYERNTIREIAKETGEKLINELIKQLGMKAEIKTQLEYCHNLILTGAPGTGKTHLAKQVARLMLFGKTDEKELNATEKVIYNNHVKFVQFHPSYDYSDFVEGLRPIQSDDDKSLGFERKDGVFKEFCKNAIEHCEVSMDNFDEAWENMIKDIQDKDYIDVQLISKKRTFRVELNQKGTGLANRTYPNNIYDKDQWIDGKSKFFTEKQLRRIYHGLKGVPGEGHDNYRRAIVEHMKLHYGLKEYVANTTDTKPYILIIDEINRGEISKIFGELFYAIDPGYRGETGKVSTQYQNLVPIDDLFANGFYVPENVYIIGTMNDIDRSVESMDFAIRRRFTWREITAQDTQKDILALLPNSIRDEAKARMDSLNNTILEQEYNLGVAYQIGASYFLKLCYDPSFENLWNYHLKGLIYEYLRGQRDIDNKLNKLHAAFNLKA